MKTANEYIKLLAIVLIFILGSASDSYADPYQNKRNQDALINNMLYHQDNMYRQQEAQRMDRDRVNNNPNFWQDKNRRDEQHRQQQNSWRQLRDSY